MITTCYIKQHHKKTELLLTISQTFISFNVHVHSAKHTEKILCMITADLTLEEKLT